VKWSDGPLYLYEFVFWALLLNSLSIEPLNLLKLGILNPFFDLSSYVAFLSKVRVIHIFYAREAFEKDKK